MRSAPFVVVVSGTSGAGKSTVVDGVASMVSATGRRAVALHFDDYADVTQLPGDLLDWLRRGADPDGWRADRLESTLLTCIAESEPGTLIIVEDPFGRVRRSIRYVVDLAIHIDLPLGVALARRLLRDFLPETGGLADADPLREYLADYLRGGGAAYSTIDRMAREASDVILDGSGDRSELLARALGEIAASADQR